MTNSAKIPVSEKIGYALGDVATNFFFQSMILYQARFYTDTAGISPAVVGWMFLVVRLADALLDPVIGALSDRTKTRWGKFRPWVLWTAIPFGAIFWLSYIVPDVGPQGKVIYAFVTYVLLMALYSANNTPYSALMGVMTPNVSERTNIARYRFVAAIFGQFLIQTFALPLVDTFGGGNDAKGYAITMAIFGAGIVVANFIVFFTTKERVLPDPSQKPNFKEDLRNVFSCGPWIALFVLTFAYFAMLVLRGTSLNYLFTYYMDPNSIRAFLEQFGLAASANGEGRGLLDMMGLRVRPDASNAVAVGFSFFQVLGSIMQIALIPLSKPLSDRFGKKTVFITGLSVVTLATAGVFFIGPTDMNSMFWLSVIWGLGWGPTVPLLWVMIADVADYSEWKTERRATGFMYAGILFALKAGLGLGGAMAGWVMGAYGYVANAVQSENALLGIRLGATMFPAVLIVFCIGCLAVYPLGKDLMLRIQNELEERRKKFAGTA
jgi:GPH family glycoside/pentoside/hexuronide:cation symporter